MAAVQETIDQVRQIDVDQYKYGFETTIEVDKAPKGLSEETIRLISARKGEPEFMLEWRLQAYRLQFFLRPLPQVVGLVGHSNRPPISPPRVDRNQANQRHQQPTQQTSAQRSG